MLQVEVYMCVALLFYSIDPCYYSYEEQEEWAEDYPLCDEGLQQSPIYLDIMKAFLDKPQTQLQFVNFDKNLTGVELTNDGTKVIAKLSPDEVNVPGISGSYLLRNYSLVSMEFHWGENDSYGSEHTFADRSERWGMEIQLYFIYKNYGENASQYEDGMVAFAFFVLADYTFFADMQEIVKYLPEIEKADTKTIMKSFPPIDKLMAFKYRGSHYSYLGSLTHPPCTEHIRWYVFRVANNMHHDQINQFRQLLNKEGDPIITNLRRPTPSLNDRLVITNRDW